MGRPSSGSGPKNLGWRRSSANRRFCHVVGNGEGTGLTPGATVPGPPIFDAARVAVSDGPPTGTYRVVLKSASSAASLTFAKRETAHRSAFPPPSTTQIREPLSSGGSSGSQYHRKLEVELASDRDGRHDIRGMTIATAAVRAALRSEVGAHTRCWSGGPSTCARSAGRGRRCEESIRRTVSVGTSRKKRDRR